MREFREKVAAITGAGSGIGRALATELADRGCHLALSDINETGLEETRHALASKQVEVTTARVDVSKRPDVFAWAEQARADHGRIHLIFNNAGATIGAPLETVALDDFEWLMGVNFWGVVHGTQAFLPHLKTAGEGHVVNISSLFGLVAMPEQGVYNASKFAVRGFTEALRMELELEGAPVRVTCVHPGGIATNIARSARFDPKAIERRGVTLEEAREQANEMIRRTTAAKAANTILRGIERNARRVLVGPDAWLLDKLARLLGGSYQQLVLAMVRSRQRRLEKERRTAVETHSR